MIRESIKNKILEMLNYDIFRRDDFQIEERDRKSVDSFTIKKDEFFFEIQFFVEKENYKIICSPGQIVDRDVIEKDRYYFESNIESEIKGWLKRVKTELLEPIAVRQFNDIIESFSMELDEKLQEVEDVYFTKEEGIQLEERLNMLEEAIRQREEAEQENEKLNLEIDKIKIELEFLKATINSMTKRKWLKNMLLKINAWRKNPENRQLIQLGMDGVKLISKNFTDIK